MELMLLLKGIIVGLLASIPLGPIGVLCVQRTINKGRLSGFFSGMGAAFADTVFATIAGFSLTFIMDFVEEWKIEFQIGGGILIFLLGLKIFMTNPISQMRKNRRQKNRLFEDFVSVFLLTVSNPMAIFLFVALFAYVNVVADGENFMSAGAILGGVLFGASLWWFTLTSFVNMYRKRFRIRQLWWINKIAGAVVMLIGIATIVELLFK
ncbi:LysE family translocator [Acetobacteroides hydrogenigenes]|uniref:Threonine/homoserine/homoserine lactone efflux protein n=1 Tax=Acetobacteroides hydrogenigenes TaxID=979970 RepID=A0A4R2F710_9BACT|nr:LysE family transporter [Acetobacteroides hydrogenigenes]TCN73040.1 threonine/homoserine/homoserine lactone efflux protein [Acetobacteroides hydrogenigenes]